jgi:RNA polymerase sigma-70 factor (ECF subfamily)
MGSAVGQASATEQSDDRLVRRCRRNDHDAFAELVERYKHRVYWLVRRMIGHEEAEDLTQEVFLRAYRALPGFRPDGTFHTWLYKIARNLCISELRKRGRRAEHVSLDEAGEERVHWLLPESGEDVEQQVLDKELSHTIRDLVDELPEQYRTVLTLFYYSQLRYEEIAEVEGIPLGTVKTHLHRARMRLRDLVLSRTELATPLRDVCANTAGAGGASQ